MAHLALIRFHFANRASRARASRLARGAGGFQKKLTVTVEQLRAEFPDEVIEVWGEDEARSGLQSILRRSRTKRAKRPTAVVEPRYEWLWLEAAEHPRSGRVFWLILPFLDGDCAQLFLDEFAPTHLSEGKRIVLARDGAPARRTQKLRVPNGITLISFAAYTPELNPSERLWSGIKEGNASERQKDIQEVE